MTRQKYTKKISKNYSHFDHKFFVESISFALF